MARMTLAEKIGQLNLMPAGEGLLTGTRQPTSLAARLENGQVGAIFGTKSLATARAMQERALAGSRLGIPLFFAEDVAFRRWISVGIEFGAGFQGRYP